MPPKPNYGQQRAERNRAKQARAEEKQLRRQEEAAQRKAKAEAEGAPPDEGDGQS